MNNIVDYIDEFSIIYPTVTNFIIWIPSLINESKKQVERDDKKYLKVIKDHIIETIKEQDTFIRNIKISFKELISKKNKKAEYMFMNICLYGESDFYSLRNLIHDMLIISNYIYKTDIEELDNYILSIISRKDILEINNDHRKFYIGIRLNLSEELLKINDRLKLFASIPILSKKKNGCCILSMRYINRKSICE